MASSTYGHYTIAQLETLRDRLLTSLHDRLTAPTSAASTGRQVQYQQTPDEIRRELAAVNGEIERRSTGVARGPIYMV